MKFSTAHTFQVLEQTPTTLTALLAHLPKEWIAANEGDDSWSAFDIVGHLIHGEKTDWIERLKIILFQADKHFEPFDRFAQFENSKGKTMHELLNEFKAIRNKNLEYLSSLNLNKEQLQQTGIHPEFGKVTLQQVLATWVTHDLGHLAQISRVLAKQYKNEVGPWMAYIPIIQK
ncbi:MAG: DinB family protein [Flavobacteriaceae bacterium]|nr:DinB family protein [Flavobacteriaceae bacterium]